MARKRNQGSNWIRRDKRLAIYLRDDCRCAYCGRGVEMGALLTLDHLRAVELGGRNTADNLVTSCRSCNSSKQDLTLRAWYRILRESGHDTAKVSRRIRRLAATDLAPYRRRARLFLASVDVEEYPTTGHLAAAV